MALSRNVAIGVVGQLIAGLDRAYTGFSEVVDAAQEAASTLQQQLQDLSHFDFNPKFKTRVISIPSAMDGFNELWDTIRNGLLAKVNKVLEDAKAVVSFLQNLPGRQPGEPLLQRTALILQFIHAFNSQLASFVRSVLDLTSTIDDIKNRIETLDDLFLPQSSPRSRGDFRYSKRNAP